MTDPSDDTVDAARAARAEHTGKAVALILSHTCYSFSGDAGVMVVVREGLACTAVHVAPTVPKSALGYWATTLAGELRELADSLERDLTEQHGPPRN